MRVDPPDAATVQSSRAHERNDFDGRHHWCLMHLLVVSQQWPAAALVADEKFAVDEVVTTHFVTSQEGIQFGGVRRAVGEESDPDRGIDQDHYATERFVGVARSRRRGTSRTCDSEPRKARRRS